ncbi:hypothetical protein BC835DRAFT_1310361 [Cytidiella melzeri]|nr:hypothetical protein BC835DRAFT_1310361 [Cytidiella melzeri]
MSRLQNFACAQYATLIQLVTLAIVLATWNALAENLGHLLVNRLALTICRSFTFAFVDWYRVASPYQLSSTVGGSARPGELVAPEVTGWYTCGLPTQYEDQSSVKVAVEVYQTFDFTGCYALRCDVTTVSLVWKFE